MSLSKFGPFALLEQDVDDSANITKDWLEQLTLQFAHRGRQLKPKAA